MSAVLLPDRVASLAGAIPARPAVTGDGGQLTYADLIQRADGVAWSLLGSGVRPGNIVGVCLERGPLAIAALLGVLRAGCAYLPLDPEYPVARLRFMLENSGAAAVLGDGTTPHALLTSQIGHVDVTATQAVAAGGTDLPRSDASDLAYVIYTSGSTGKPKGVAVEHGNVARLFDSVAEHIPVDRQDVWSWFHSAAFDFSVWEIWGALTSGGRVAVAGRAEARDPAAFLEILRRSGTTILSQTPSAFLRLLPLLRAGEQSWSVRAVILGGEAVSVDALAEPLTGGIAHGWPRIYNLYGITETTVHASVKELTARDLTAGVRSPIGMALSDLRFAVLDASARPLPAGEQGELWVGGAGVARGYIGLPELTSERFVAGLLPQLGSMRWYRSGDIVRQLGTGEFEYIGRIDRQVKLRGFRIELSEIEAAILGHPDVSAAAADLLPAGPQDEDRLVAYLVPRQSAEPTLDGIREWLTARLPGYMVPSSFWVIDSLPLTVNGKVDRDAMRHLSATELRSDPRRDGPLTMTEASLRPIWTEVLGSDLIGRDDNFFAVGGDSMLALRLVARCKAAGMRLTMRDLYQNPTISALAAVVPIMASQDAAEQAGHDSVARPVPADVDMLIPAGRMQVGVLFEYERQADAGTYHVVSACTLTCPAELTELSLLAALRRLADDNIALRTSFDFLGHDVPMQVIHPEADVQLRYLTEPATTGKVMAQDARSTAIGDAVASEQQHRFSRTDYPLWRVRCVRTSARSASVILTHHHAILDGWSVAIFYDQLQEAIAGRPYQPASPGVNAEAARLEANSMGSARDEEYWRVKARDWKPLPVAEKSGSASLRPVVRQAVIDSDMAKKIGAAAAIWGCSPKHIHVAAHLRALARFARWEDYSATSLVVNARPEETGAHKALGMFLNVVPLAIKGMGSSWAELSLLAMAAERSLLPHRWFPLAAMIKRFMIPAPNVWINYTNFSATAMRGFLSQVSEVSPTGMPLTVSVVDDGLIIEASPRYFSANECTRLLEAHLGNVWQALAESERT